jgi:hypothetical protein
MMIIIHSPMPVASLVPPTNEPFELPVLDERWGSVEQWLNEHDEQGAFSFSVDELLAAMRRADGYIGCIVGVRCYIKQAIQAVAT